jgi:hypothetical protein
MSQGDFVKISHLSEVERKLPFLLKRLEQWDYSTALCIKFEPYADPRSLNQNALFHIWCKQMSEAFLGKVPDATPEGVKWMMKHKFLETHNIKVGQTEIKGQIQSTTKLKKGEMCFFMDQVYDWAAAKGVFLSLPQYNEYTELKRKQDK